MKIWKLFNLFVLVLALIIVSLGTFYKHISFGWGLGDLFGYALMYGLLITHLVLTLINRKKSESYFVRLSIIFLLLLIWTCLEATIWRDTEYRWNGNLFYDNMNVPSKDLN